MRGFARVALRCFVGLVGVCGDQHRKLPPAVAIWALRFASLHPRSSFGGLSVWCPKHRKYENRSVQAHRSRTGMFNQN